MFCPNQILIFHQMKLNTQVQGKVNGVGPRSAKSESGSNTPNTVEDATDMSTKPEGTNINSN